MDVFFFAYANSETQQLQSLTEEQDYVNRTLIRNHIPDSFQIYYEQLATVEKINSYLRMFSNRISLFHYSGHADKDHIFLQDYPAHTGGLINQLEQSARQGVLKLVVLNGCCTAANVQKLLEIGVPAIIATNTYVGDASAKEFAKRFYEELFEEQTTIREAYNSAINAAQVGSSEDLRHIQKSNVINVEPDTPLWGIFGRDEMLDSNPFDHNPLTDISDYTPTKKLLEKLFEVLKNAAAPEISELLKRPKTKLIAPHEKRDAILESLPLPIGFNLTQLLNTQSAREKEHNDKDEQKIKLLSRMGQLYHSTAQFMGLIMVAQIWELKLAFDEIKINPYLKELLRSFFYLTPADRNKFDYLTLIKEIRKAIDEEAGKNKDIQLFVKEQLILKELLITGDQFTDACEYLLKLHHDLLTGRRRRDVNKDLMTAEDQLCHFFNELGFLHRYHLTSIIHIDILKYRHLKPDKAKFKHRVSPLMYPHTRQSEERLIHYFIPTFLDNWGVVLIKDKTNENVIDQHLREVNIDKVDFLNLSPFIIDRIVFEEKKGNTDSILMLFSQYGGEQQSSNGFYEFSDITDPDKPSENFKVQKSINSSKKKHELQSIRLQFEDFRTKVLGEPLS